jgi:hypothetical protein
VQNEFNCNNEKMAGYLVEVRKMEKFVNRFEVQYVQRLDNCSTNHLAWMHPIKMFIEYMPPLDDNAEVERIARKSKQYHLIDVILFR